MKLIAHRGLMFGPDVNIENRPAQIDFAIKAGFDVEIDVWYLNGEIFLGHDRPDYKVNLDFLKRKEVWAHAKNLPALDFLLENNITCFWHENDERTLTSNGYIWTYPNKATTKKSIVVVFDSTLDNVDKENLYGVCGDYVARW